MISFFDNLRHLVANDALELALDQLATFLKGGVRPDLYREVLVQSGRLTRSRKQARQGLISEERASTEQAQIADALLQLIDEISASVEAARRPFSMPTVSLEAPVAASLEKVFGISHLKSIAWLQQGIEAARSVCRVITPKGLGTGFLIGDSLVMTNHHVLSQPDVASRCYVEFNFQEDASGRLQEPCRYRLIGEGLRADEELDACLVRVLQEDLLPSLKSWGELTLANSVQPEVGEHVTIIQHPGGGPKQIALTANQIVNIFEHRLQYTTDTLPGSSGSPVFDDSWNVIAIHRAGGNLVINQQGDRMFANEGVLISKISEKLALG